MRYAISSNEREPGDNGSVGQPAIQYAEMMMAASQTMKTHAAIHIPDGCLLALSRSRQLGTT